MSPLPLLLLLFPIAVFAQQPTPPGTYNPSILGPIHENEYGPGIHGDATGRPFQWETQNAPREKVFGPVDMVFGFIGDAGVVLRKFGEDAKPMVDRLRELVEIAWKASLIAYGLPGDTPLNLLPPKRDC